MRALIIAGVCILSLSVSHAQMMSARRLTSRITGAPPVPPRAAPAAPAPARPAPVARPTVPANGTRLVAVDPEDSERSRADHAEAEKKTVEFQTKRAKEGQPSAQYELGVRYLTGKGVPKDEKEGRKWLQLAADNGNTQAKKKLADLSKAAELGLTLDGHLVESSGAESAAVRKPDSGSAGVKSKEEAPKEQGGGTRADAGGK